jgi:hypothetical protein
MHDIADAARALRSGTLHLCRPDATLTSPSFHVSARLGLPPLRPPFRQGCPPARLSLGRSVLTQPKEIFICVPAREPQPSS